MTSRKDAAAPRPAARLRPGHLCAGGQGEQSCQRNQDSSPHSPQPTRDPGGERLTSAADGVHLSGWRSRSGRLVRGLERGRAPAPAGACRPASRGRHARARRALRRRPARAAERGRGAAPPFRVPAGHAPGARPARAPRVARTGHRGLVARAATRSRPSARRRGDPQLRAPGRRRLGRARPPAFPANSGG